METVNVKWGENTYVHYLFNIKLLLFYSFLHWVQGKFYKGLKKSYYKQKHPVYSTY